MKTQQKYHNLRGILTHIKNNRVEVDSLKLNKHTNFNLPINEVSEEIQGQKRIHRNAYKIGQ